MDIQKGNKIKRNRAKY